jgi:hypothetical protein
MRTTKLAAKMKYLKGVGQLVGFRDISLMVRKALSHDERVPAWEVAILPSGTRQLDGAVRSDNAGL